MGGIRRFLTQQVTIRPCIEERLIALPAFFSDGQRDRAAGIPVFDLRHQAAHPLVGKIAVLAALKDKGAKTKFIPSLAAVQNLLLAQTVPLGVAF